jgi:cell division protein FtsI/penicillin-binding protein 2
MPARASILARDGTPLAAGEPRLAEAGRSAAGVIGHVAPPTPEQQAAAAERGLPAGALVGQAGLEEALEGRLAGRPGGRLYAGTRLVASARPRRGEDVRTTIEPTLQAAADQALAGRYGAAVALDPAGGDVLAIAGPAALAPQPPGSVFKIITLAAGLEHGVVKPGDSFPVETATTLEGVRLENANGEACGGTLRNSFAHSCNSVFAPLGVRVGARRLVAMAERFGFNRSSLVPGEPPSSMPPAAEIGGPLALGSTAIGQGRLLATTTQMASVAATIATGGRRHAPTLLDERRQSPRRVLAPRVARLVGDYMTEVVESGTGTAAALPGIRVAGKTGTAELRRTTGGPAVEGEAQVDDPTDTDAWFAAFAPRASRSPSCSSAAARAARPPRRPRASCCRPGWRPTRADQTSRSMIPTWSGSTGEWISNSRGRF